MPGAKLEFGCVVCGEVDPLEFRYNRKTLCRQHDSLHKDKDIKEKMIQPYKCIICGTMDEDRFYKSKKSKCRYHYGVVTTELPKIVIIENNNEKTTPRIVIKPSSSSLD